MARTTLSSAHIVYAYTVVNRTIKATTTVTLGRGASPHNMCRDRLTRLREALVSSSYCLPSFGGRVSPLTTGTHLASGANSTSMLLGKTRHPYNSVTGSLALPLNNRIRCGVSTPRRIGRVHVIFSDSLGHGNSRGCGVHSGCTVGCMGRSVPSALTGRFGMRVGSRDNS